MAAGRFRVRGTHTLHELFRVGRGRSEKGQRPELSGMRFREFAGRRIDRDHAWSPHPGLGRFQRACPAHHPADFRKALRYCAGGWRSPWQVLLWTLRSASGKAFVCERCSASLGWWRDLPERTRSASDGWSRQDVRWLFAARHWEGALPSIGVLEKRTGRKFSNAKLLCTRGLAFPEKGNTEGCLQAAGRGHRHRRLPEVVFRLG